MTEQHTPNFTTVREQAERLLRGAEDAAAMSGEPKIMAHVKSAQGVAHALFDIAESLDELGRTLRDIRDSAGGR